MEPFQLSSLHNQCSVPLPLIQRVREEEKAAVMSCSQQSPGWTRCGSDRLLTRPRGLAAATEPNWLLT